MKGIFLVLTFVASSLLASSQNVYRAHKTEMYTKEYSGDWELYSKNSDTKIQICLEDEFITIWAKSPSLYKIYKSEGEEIKGKTFTGMSYPAKDLKTDKMCIIHVINLDGEYVLSVVKSSEKYNLRYYLKDVE